MHIILVGLSHETAPVELREKLTFQTQKLEEALNQLTQSKTEKDTEIEEAFIISTCNRVEIYGLTQNIHKGIKFIKKFFSEFSNVSLQDFENYLHTKSDLEAVEHLYSVTSGIQSMVLGENQIQCQVKQAFEKAQKQNTAGPFFSTLCRSALSVGKRVRSETEISKHSLSISHAAVKLVQNTYHDISSLNILILGLGKMSLIAVKSLINDGAKNLTIINRTERRVEDNPKELNVKTLDFSRLEECLMQADVVISSTAAPHVILTYEQVERAAMNRPGRPLLIIDIAVPRDVDSKVAQLENVCLYNIDQLETDVEINRVQRKNELSKVNNIIAQEVENFAAWYESLKIKPVIKELCKQAEEIREQELKRAMRRFENELNQHDRRLVKDLTRRIINKVLHQPLVCLRQEAEHGNSQQLSAVVQNLFGIEMTNEERVLS